MVEHRRPDVGDDRGASPRIQAVARDADRGGDDDARAQSDENGDQHSLVPRDERVVDQIAEAERDPGVERRLHPDAEKEEPELAAVRPQVGEQKPDRFACRGERPLFHLRDRRRSGFDCHFGRRHARV